MLIDTHCHLHDQEWFTPEQSEQFLQEAHQAGVEQVICIGTNPEDSQNARNFAEAHPGVFWTYGIHPEFASDPAMVTSVGLPIFRESAHRDLAQLEGVDAVSQELRRDQRGAPKRSLARDDGTRQACSEKQRPHPVATPVAIGEIGLDYHYDGYNRQDQIRLFEQMLQLALNLDLPVSLHIREAFEDALAVLDNFPQTRGVVHSFTGSKRHLKASLERGFYVGVNGLCTYTTNPLPPLEKMLLETDAPFLTPVPFRGTINKPGYVQTIATYLSEELGVAEANIVEQTTQNARQLFRI